MFVWSRGRIKLETVKGRVRVIRKVKRTGRNARQKYSTGKKRAKGSFGCGEDKRGAIERE